MLELIDKQHWQKIARLTDCYFSSVGIHLGYTSATEWCMAIVSKPLNFIYETDQDMCIICTKSIDLNIYSDDPSVEPESLEVLFYGFPIHDQAEQEYNKILSDKFPGKKVTISNLLRVINNGEEQISTEDYNDSKSAEPASTFS